MPSKIYTNSGLLQLQRVLLAIPHCQLIQLIAQLFWGLNPRQHQQCHRCVLAVGPPCLPPSFFLLPLCPRAQPCSEPSWCLLRLFSPHHCWGGCQRGQAEQPHFPGHQLLLRESLWALMCRAGDSSPTGMVGVRDRDPCMGSVLPRLFVWGGRWV